MTDRQIIYNLLKLARQQQRRIRFLERQQIATMYLLHKHAPEVYAELSAALEFVDDMAEHPAKYAERSDLYVLGAMDAQLNEQGDEHDPAQAWISDALKFLGEEPTKDLQN